MLQLPLAWTTYLAHASASALATGPRFRYGAPIARYTSAVAALGDAQRAATLLVTRPHQSALREAAPPAPELATLGLHNQELVINGVFRATDRTDPVALALEQRGQHALKTMPEALRALPHTTVLLQGHNIVGIPALRTLLRTNQEEDYSRTREAHHTVFPELPIGGAD